MVRPAGQCPGGRPWLAGRAVFRATLPPAGLSSLAPARAAGG